MQIRIYFFVIALFFVAGSSQAQQQICKSTTIVASTNHLVGGSDGTVTDSKTKLMWKRCPEGFNYSSANNTCAAAAGTASLYTWSNALARPGVANATKFANYENWRLPNIKELQSIVEEQCYNPAINLTIFPSTSISSVWSNSPLPDASNAWYINFYFAEMLYGSLSSENLGVRLVRDMQ
ncbi:MAG: Protein of unknown function (DUF1566) [Candidatus Electronema aureum]|uniref:Lcl C-terminal domain-containing protein n=1 Tax=Candidatus Electronema aureum TaxID=2005002 RepID=A0A521FYR1_9BACT|nr:MAG: Protein of unknown function (DUF1566) [Candidatus Electronema aureum]